MQKIYIIVKKHPALRRQRAGACCR